MSGAKSLDGAICFQVVDPLLTALDVDPAEFWGRYEPRALHREVLPLQPATLGRMLRTG
ncbi:hypothetical protein ABZT43_22070 [Streptomyces sp. NPDC005349]|uniref:hypothetical protein n=1 Tax=Streptomyces sp. NPDC005349 TaxID=3157037 RepID=UPI0033AA1F26